MTTLADLRREHQILTSLMASLALPEQAGPKEAERARQNLILFARHVIEHFAHEDPVLAELTAAPVGTAMRTAGDARIRESQALAEGCASFSRHWTHPGAIERDPKTFGSALGILQAAVARLVRREETEVYPLAVTGWAPHPVLAPPLTGIAELDDDHIEIFSMIGGLRAIVDDRLSAVDGAHVAALAAYAERHFAREESIMEATSYPGLEDHRQEHHRARAILMGFRNDYLDGRRLDAITVLKFLESWLSSHIAEVDQRMVAHVRHCGSGIVSSDQTLA
ncbi:MAG: hemerythrin family protein [Planctomycetes bacterium]|nr:hemerythrin family protein [Planctomycetota bacterium]